MTLALVLLMGLYALSFSLILIYGDRKDTYSITLGKNVSVYNIAHLYSKFLLQAN